MARVLGELEVQKRLSEKQQKEINLVHEKMLQLEVENSKLIELDQSLSNSLHQQ